MPPSGTPRVPTKRNKSCKRSDEWPPREKESFVTTTRSSSTTEVRNITSPLLIRFSSIYSLISWGFGPVTTLFCSVSIVGFVWSFVCCIFFLFPPPFCMVLGLYLYLNLVVYWNKAFLPKCLETNPIVL